MQSIKEMVRSVPISPPCKEEEERLDRFYEFASKCAGRDLSSEFPARSEKVLGTIQIVFFDNLPITVSRTGQLWYKDHMVWLPHYGRRVPVTIFGKEGVVFIVVKTDSLLVLEDIDHKIQSRTIPITPEMCYLNKDQQESLFRGVKAIFSRALETMDLSNCSYRKIQGAIIRMIVCDNLPITLSMAGELCYQGSAKFRRVNEEGYVCVTIEFKPSLLLIIQDVATSNIHCIQWKDEERTPRQITIYPQI